MSCLRTPLTAVLFVLATIACTSAKEIAVPVAKNSKEFNDRIEMAIAMLPLTPEENKLVREKLARTPIPASVGYVVRVFADDGRTFAGDTCTRHVATADKVDAYYTSVWNAAAYAIASPISQGKAITDDRLSEWRRGVGTPWLDCSGLALEHFGSVIKDPNFDPMVKSLCNEFILRKALTNLWITESWDDPLPPQSACAMHCAPNTGKVVLALFDESPESRSFDYGLNCRLDCPQTVAASTPQKQ
ncbi:MAG: hypothetical protein HY435_01775 [Candidatus Liptonbacteria bacterium]|nr:hypothetical protein [Candidatus Liptonbacteria bacterium]